MACSVRLPVAYCVTMTETATTLDALAGVDAPDGEAATQEALNVEAAMCLRVLAVRLAAAFAVDPVTGGAVPLDAVLLDVLDEACIAVSNALGVSIDD